MFFCTVLQMAQNTYVNVGTASGRTNIGNNVTENNYIFHNVNVNQTPPPRELQGKELQDRSVYFLLFCT